MAKSKESDDSLDVGDPGLGFLYGGLLEKSKNQIERAEGAYHLARLTLRDRVTLDFIKHPFRDGISTAVALGGLGAVAGAAIASRKH